jgi:hypothetical protein
MPNPCGVVTLSPGPERGPTARSIGARRKRLLIWTAVGFALLVCVLVAIQGDEFTSTVAEFPAWAALGAVVTQLCWLACRGEAWRLALNAVGPREVPRTDAHLANALAFGVGAAQSLATVPVRALALRRLAPQSSPTLEQTLVADAPVLALEGTLMGLILLIVVATTPAFPGWGAAGVFAAGVLTLAALVIVGDRLHGRGLAAGLRVLDDRRRRVKLVGLTVTMSGLALSRSWFVLAGFGLPHGFPTVATFLAALGIAAALPIGLASTPAAALALFGATDAARATGAGIGMAATSLLAVILYGGLSLALAALAARRRRAAAAPPVGDRAADERAVGRAA